ncbi:hypothetical protein [Flammeovirga sp. SubArs3]|uniref:hypothetical protein n=1 Tax=Flammeovirga sp. SubArs3 TaxID=2995316 RepID=UPI00248C5663|nr:hypothetical protein [Flammeovirga sp. SubArs3]
MMRKHFSKKYINAVLPLFLGLFFSCEKFVDTTAPEIREYTVNGEDGTGEVMVDTLSTDLIVTAYFVDDYNLLSYKLGFEYKGTDDSPGLRFPAYLVYEDTFAIAGAQTEIYQTFTVASGQTTGSLFAGTGEYEIYIQAKDRALNESQVSRIPIEFKNFAPYFKFPEYEIDTITHQQANSIIINAYMDDLDNNMNQCEMLMYWRMPDEIEESGYYDSLIHDFALIDPVPGAGQFDISEMYSFPDTGLYDLRVSGFDQRRNNTLAQITFKVE